MKQIENKQRSTLHTIYKNVCAWNMKKVRIPYYRIADNATVGGML